MGAHTEVLVIGGVKRGGVVGPDRFTGEVVVGTGPLPRYRRRIAARVVSACGAVDASYEEVREYGFSHQAR
jgi:hypothetical protein